VRAFEGRDISWYRVVTMDAGVDKSREEKIEQLKRYFEHRNDVVMAFLFGSQAEGRARKASDWDIGVYFRRGKDARENSNEIRRDVERITDREVDIVMLNEASARVAWPVVNSGVVLALKDHDTYMREVERLSEEADAWYQTADSFYQISLRSASLSMRDRARLHEIVEFLNGAVHEYKRFRSLSQAEYMNEKDVKRSLEHWIEHMVNASVDIAKIIWASERRPIPETYHDFLIALGGIEPFNADDGCQKLAEWAYLRNALAHEYLDYRFKEISAFLAETEPLFIALLDHTKKFLANKTEHDSART